MLLLILLLSRLSSKLFYIFDKWLIISNRYKEIKINIQYFIEFMLGNEHMSMFYILKN